MPYFPPLLAAYPIGSIYINTSDTNPGTFLGGTWTAFGAGRVPVGFDSGQTEFDVDEETGGAKTHTLITSEIPSHSHATTSDNLNLIQFVGSGGSIATSAGSVLTGTSSPVTGTAGSGGAHNNLQPYIVVRMWKRTA